MAPNLIAVVGSYLRVCVWWICAARVDTLKQRFPNSGLQSSFKGTAKHFKLLQFFMVFN